MNPGLGRGLSPINVDGAPPARAAMQRDATGGMIIVWARGIAFDGGRPAGRTHQRFMVPICRDQYQRFRRAVLLDAPTTHSRSFRWE